MIDYIRCIRQAIGNTRIIIPGVRALIFRPDGALLLEKERLWGSWALPHGCVDVGESVYEALRREINEETGLTIHEAEPFGLYTDPRYAITYPNGDEVQTFTVAFVVTRWSGDPRVDGEEVDELGFFDLRALPEPLYPIHVDTIEDYRAAPGRFHLR